MQPASASTKSGMQTLPHTQQHTRTARAHWHARTCTRARTHAHSGSTHAQCQCGQGQALAGMLTQLQASDCSGTHALTHACKGTLAKQMQQTPEYRAGLFPLSAFMLHVSGARGRQCLHAASINSSLWTAPLGMLMLALSKGLRLGPAKKFRFSIPLASSSLSAHLSGKRPSTSPGLDNVPYCIMPQAACAACPRLKVDDACCTHQADGNI